MSKSQAKSAAGKIFDNILFLAEVFGDQAERDIPKLSVLEMAQCFDLEIAAPNRTIGPSGIAENNERLRVRYLFRRWVRLFDRQCLRRSARERALRNFASVNRFPEHRRHRT